VRRALRGADLDELTAAAETVPAGCDGLLFLPYLRGERVPDLPRASGALLGVVPGALEPGRLFRAAMEGATLALASGAERMRHLGIRVGSVRIVGGGARSRLWRQIVADALGVPVVRLAEEESAAFGAALQALWAARVAAGERVGADEVASAFVRTSGPPEEPDATRVAVYREARERLEEMTARLFGRSSSVASAEGARSEPRANERQSD
jgi:xylulokinase